MAELTPSTREAARRLGVSDTTMHKAERTGRITREPDGRWDIAKTRARLLETSDPYRPTLAGSAAAEAIEAIDFFKLGYANRTLALRLPEKNRKAGADRARLQLHR